MNKIKDILENIVSAPAVTLEKTVAASEKIGHSILNKTPVRRLEQYWHTLGPGLTTGAADDDPSGITTYTQTGARYGFQLLWLAGFTFPLMAVVQEMCARIALVTGRGLAGNIRAHYPRWVLYTATALLFTANTFNLGADLGAMAQASRLLNPNLSFAALVVGFAFVSLLLQIFTTYASYAKYLKYLALILFAYIFSALSLNLNWSEILRQAVIPSISWNREQIFLICGILGTTISPYLFFWQTAQEVEEEILRGETTLAQRQRGTTPQDLKRMRLDVWSGMFFSNLVMFFIIVTSAATLFANGITNISSAAEAAQALRPFAGDSAYLLFTIGIIGTGLLAIPVLAGSASYALSESFGWKFGLYRKLKEAHAFYGVIIISMLIGLGLNFIGLDPIKALIYAAVANGLAAPLLLILIMQISGRKHIMGEHKNGPITTTLGWIITGTMILTGVATILVMIF